MIMSIVCNSLLFVLALAMLAGGKYGRTRQAGIAPLMMAAIDSAFITKLDLTATPVLSAVLVALQMVVLAAGAWVLYQDRVQAKNKALRRRRRRDIARSRAAFENAAAHGETLRVCA